MSAPGEAVSLAAKRMQRHPAPKPPINSLCNSDEPEDVLAAAGAVVGFVRAVFMSQTSDRERNSDDFNNGMVYVLEMVRAAMTYASDLCAHKGQCQRQD